ncbi:hypothetical protein N9A08_12800 [Arthrobacter koreensis]|uniref:Uncharacterized protein n=1 Tax=Arthrobacter koreensis TaxID=199136 RepID=A0ABY6FQL3_9MICC|nr:hypothetical protein [Arthrobacter koreensis]UYB35496.1 hypothetical protein N9A08_12800 [Arthrobacter koreensis]
MNNEDFDTNALWSALMADEDDSEKPVTATDINRQTFARFSIEEAVSYDSIDLRFFGQSTSDHRMGVRPASRALVAIQEAISAVAATLSDYVGKAGRLPSDILAATELKLTPQLQAGSVIFTLVHEGEEQQSLFPIDTGNAFEHSFSSLLSLFDGIADNSSEENALSDIRSFGPRAAKHLFDFSQVLLQESLSVDLVWNIHSGEQRRTTLTRKSAAFLQDIAKSSTTSSSERHFTGQLITVSEIDKQALMLDDQTKISMDAGHVGQDDLADLYRQRVVATVEETLTVNISTGTETSNYTLLSIRPAGVGPRTDADLVVDDEAVAGWTDTSQWPYPDSE